MTDDQYQIDSLDGLRGFAALIVVLSHTSLAKMYFLPGFNFSGVGKAGVYLFFLLSSFLLTLPLLKKGKDIISMPSLSHYFQRRFFRIYPLYTLYLLLAVISSWMATSNLRPDSLILPFELDLQGLINHLALIEGRGVTWSIAVEFKFYFVLPILALLASVISVYGIIHSSIFFLALIVFSQLISPQSSAAVNDSSLLPYMPIFLMGMYLAVLQHEIQNNKINLVKITKWLRALGYLGMIGIILTIPSVYSIIEDDVANNRFHKDFILYAILWSFVLLSAVNVEGHVQNFFKLMPLRFCGALSFSLYLFHAMIIEIFKRVGIEGYIGAWSVLVLSVFAAYLSFKFLEAPISKFKVSFVSEVPVGIK